MTKTRLETKAKKAASLRERVPIRKLKYHCRPKTPAEKRIVQPTQKMHTAENAMRPITLGRKNWLFVGSERGGRAAALFMSLVKSCKDLDINPWEYLDDMLRRIMSHPISRLRELLPDQWKPLPKDKHGLLIAQNA